MIKKQTLIAAFLFAFTLSGRGSSADLAHRAFRGP